MDNEQLRRACNDLQKLGDVNVVTDMAILSLVGQNLRNKTGISGAFFRVLGENDINIEMISQGECNLSLSNAEQCRAKSG